MRRQPGARRHVLHGQEEPLVAGRCFVRLLDLCPVPANQSLQANAVALLNGVTGDEVSAQVVETRMPPPGEPLSLHVGFRLANASVDRPRHVTWA